jgi:hypothetical protein
MRLAFVCLNRMGWRVGLLRKLVAGALLIGFALTLLMAASASFHTSVHEDADEQAHECAVTLMLSGGSDEPVLSPIACPVLVWVVVGSVCVEDAHDSGAQNRVGCTQERAPPQGDWL